MARRTASRSLMLPLMKEILLRISARFSSLPAERSSSATTLSPRRTSSSTVLEPIKPAPPVTTYRIRAILSAQGCINFRALPQDARKRFWYPDNSGFVSTNPETRKPGKSAASKTGSHDNVVYDERQAPKIFNRAHVAGKL